MVTAGAGAVGCLIHYSQHYLLIYFFLEIYVDILFYSLFLLYQQSSETDEVQMLFSRQAPNDKQDNQYFVDYEYFQNFVGSLLALTWKSPAMRFNSSHSSTLVTCRLGQERDLDRKAFYNVNREQKSYQ